MFKLFQHIVKFTERIFARLSYTVYCNAYKNFPIFQFEFNVFPDKVEISNLKVGCCQGDSMGCKYEYPNPFILRGTKNLVIFFRKSS